MRKGKKAMHGTFKIRFCSITKDYFHVLQRILRLNSIFNNIKYLFVKIAGSLQGLTCNCLPKAVVMVVHIEFELVFR